MGSLAEQFGSIDIYLFDQLLRGNIAPGMRVLDAGCGVGRNLVYLLREGYEVFGVDGSQEAIEAVRSLAAKLAPGLDPENFQVSAVEEMPYEDGFADVVISSAVLHFAQDDAQFNGMVQELWRVLRPGGLFFCRLASSIGGNFQRLVGRRFVLPGGEERYLVDEELLMTLTAGLDGEMVDPLKTSVVQGVRCMTTWVLRKRLG